MFSALAEQRNAHPTAFEHPHITPFTATNAEQIVSRSGQYFPRRPDILESAKHNLMVVVLKWVGVLPCQYRRLLRCDFYSFDRQQKPMHICMPMIYPMGRSVPFVFQIL